jgi:N-methylhydantoinase B
VPFTVNTMCDQIREEPYGLDGGRAGEPGRYLVSGGDQLSHYKAMVTLPGGADIIMQLPGGGGMGHPHLRDPSLVLADVESGLVTADSARDDYGVVVQQAGTVWTLDAGATEHLRQSQAV